MIIVLANNKARKDTASKHTLKRKRGNTSKKKGGNKLNMRPKKIILLRETSFRYFFLYRLILFFFLLLLFSRPGFASPLKRNIFLAFSKAVASFFLMRLIKEQRHKGRKKNTFTAKRAS